MSGFEGSFLGNSDRIAPDTALECGVCWWVYDPARGDDTWQIPAGTPFADLPEHWRCPGCDTARSQFMVLQPGGRETGSRPRPALPDSRATLRRRQRQVVAAYSAVDSRMRDLPVYNDQLDIQLVGLRHWQDDLLGILVTPWCMNILLLPGDVVHAPMEGTTRDITFPSGCYRFTAGQVDGIGPLESCSLFSPMDPFDNPATAREVAQHALLELLKPPEVAPPAALSRRAFLRGRSPSPDDPAA